jgi:hypothetical protein
MLIDCDTCVGRGIACDDCVINVLLQQPQAPLDASAALELDEAEQHALATLAGAGLVPPLRLVPSVRFETPEPGDTPGHDEFPTFRASKHRGIA